MRRYNWTKKRRVALDCLARSMGNVRLAAELSEGQVSEGYLNNLKYGEKHIPFRKKFYELTEKLLNSMEIDAKFVISRLVKMADPDFPPPQRIQALRLLGDYLGIWAPQRHEVSGEIAHKILEFGLDAESVIAEAEQIVRDASRGVGR